MASTSKSSPISKARSRTLRRQVVIGKARELSVLSRSQLVEETGLSPATVSNVVRELIAEGILTEIGAGESRGGRPTTLLRYEEGALLAAVVELDREQARIAIAGWDGQVVLRRSLSFGNDPVAELAALIEELQQELEGSLRAVCVAVPGVATDGTGELSLAPSLRPILGRPLAEQLRAATGLPVVVDNDVNLLMAGEHARGAAEGVRDAALLHVGNTGIGAAFLLDGAVRTGAHGLAGEIGFLPLAAGAHQRGDTGDFERQWSTEGLRTQAADAGMNLDPARSPLQGLLALAPNVPEAAALLEQALDVWARAVVALVCVIDPALVLLSGELAAAGEKGAALLSEQVARYWPKQVVLQVAAEGDALSLGAVRRAFAAAETNR